MNVKDARACLTDGVTDNITFKSAQSEKMASELRFTERQTTAILEMRLQKLIGLEIEALMKDHEDTLKHIAEYEEILENRADLKVILSVTTSVRHALASFTFLLPRRISIIRSMTSHALINPSCISFLSNSFFSNV